MSIGNSYLPLPLLLLDVRLDFRLDVDADVVDVEEEALVLLVLLDVDAAPLTRRVLELPLSPLLLLDVRLDFRLDVDTDVDVEEDVVIGTASVSATEVAIISFEDFTRSRVLLLLSMEDLS